MLVHLAYTSTYTDTHRNGVFSWFICQNIERAQICGAVGVQMLDCTNTRTASYSHEARIKGFMEDRPYAVWRSEFALAFFSAFNCKRKLSFKCKRFTRWLVVRVCQ